MGEFRQDRVSGEWVVIAADRSARPRHVSLSRKSAEKTDESAVCPFCPGNEDQLLGITAEYPADTPPGWSVRSVFNKFPAFRPDGEAAPPETETFSPQAAFGYQELIVETPRHGVDLRLLDDSAIADAVRAYRDRFTALMDRNGINYVMLFRNYGPGSGASLPHAHAQLAATAFYPPRLRRQEIRSQSYFEEHGRCPVCDDLHAEIEASVRLVDDCDAFVTFVPFAAEKPFELWIVPRRHQARFDEMTTDEITALGIALRRALKRLYAVHGDVAYNFAIESAGADGGGAAHSHWRLHLVPRLADWAGYELGTGVFVNASSPEENARTLREATPA